MGGVLDAEKLQTLPDVLNTSKSFLMPRRKPGTGASGERSGSRGAHGKGNG